MMAEGRSREVWEHTSAILAMLANVNRASKSSRTFVPLDFDPYRAAKKRDAGDSGSAAKVGIDVLKDVFVKKRRS